MNTSKIGGFGLTQQDLEEFKKAWKQEFGEELSNAEAREMATRLLTLYELLSRPLPPEADSHPQQ